MPNLCSNTIKIIGEEKRLTELKASLEKCLKNNICTLKDVAKAHGVIIADNIYCRGYIAYVDNIEDDTLMLQSETAWGPTNEFWDCFTKELNFKYASISEECGMGIYVIHNDLEGRYFSENYLIDIWEKYKDFTEDYFYFETKAEICEFMNEIIPEQNFKNFKDVEEYFSNVDFGNAYQYQRD